MTEAEDKIQSKTYCKAVMNNLININCITIVYVLLLTKRSNKRESEREQERERERKKGEKEKPYCPVFKTDTILKNIDIKPHILKLALNYFKN